MLDCVVYKKNYLYYIGNDNLFFVILFWMDCLSVCVVYYVWRINFDFSVRFVFLFLLVLFCVIYVYGINIDL